MNTDEHIRNRSQFPHEELLKYVGKYVAWSPDGSKIVASDEDPLKLTSAVQFSGYDPSEVVLSFVPPPDAGFLGSMLFGECRT